MTVVINYVSDHLSVIMTDRRIAYGKNAEYGYSDNEIKLIDLPEMGWIAGAGLSNYLDILKEEVANHKISTIGDVMDIYEQVTKQAVERHPEFEEDVYESMLSFSFHNFDYDSSKFRFHIGLLSSDLVHDEGTAAVAKEQIHIIYPTDVAYDDVNGPKIHEKHYTNYKFKNIEDLIRRLLEVYKDIYSVSDYVSEQCDIGIHMYNESYKERGIYKLKISGSVNKLITLYDEGKIFDEVKIINKIT